MLIYTKFEKREDVRKYFYMLYGMLIYFPPRPVITDGLPAFFSGRRPAELHAVRRDESLTAGNALTKFDDLCLDVVE